jgi:hypothetical protein
MERGLRMWIVLSRRWMRSSWPGLSSSASRTALGIVIWNLEEILTASILTSVGKDYRSSEGM